MQLNKNEHKNRVSQWIISSFPYAKCKYVMDIQNDIKYNYWFFGFQILWLLAYLMKVIPETYLMKVIPETSTMQNLRFY